MITRDIQSRQKYYYANVGLGELHSNTLESSELSFIQELKKRPFLRDRCGHNRLNVDLKVDAGSKPTRLCTGGF